MISTNACSAIASFRFLMTPPNNRFRVWWPKTLRYGSKSFMIGVSWEIEVLGERHFFRCAYYSYGGDNIYHPPPRGLTLMPRPNARTRTFSSTSTNTVANSCDAKDKLQNSLRIPNIMTNPLQKPINRRRGFNWVKLISCFCRHWKKICRKLKFQVDMWEKTPTNQIGYLNFSRPWDDVALRICAPLAVCRISRKAGSKARGIPGLEENGCSRLPWQ